MQRTSPDRLPLRIGSVVLALGFLAFVALSVRIPAETASVSQVEAAYLYNFTKLAEWPQSKLTGDAPLVIGVFGREDDFIEILRQTVSGKAAGSHPIAVKPITSDADLKSCALVFFRSSDRKRVATVIRSLSGESVLLVGEDDGFLNAGGMINLLVESGKVRFEVNRETLDQAGIHLSANLLALAKVAGGSRSASVQPGAGGRGLQDSPPPEYPGVARTMNLKGTVQLRVVVNRDGTVKKVAVVGGPPLFADALAKAVLKWKYNPARAETTEIVRYDFP